jgi:uncharacterized membrane protein YgaE (UPF0421/DUF939 family)
MNMKVKMETFKDIFVYLFLILLFVYGLYMTLGALRNWNSFLYAYKRFDLIEAFGNLGRLLYVILGLVISIIAILLFLKHLGIGPLAGLK